MKKNVFDINATSSVVLWVVLLPQVLVFAAEIILSLVASVLGTTLQEMLHISAIAITISLFAQLAFLLIVINANRTINIAAACQLHKNFGKQNLLVCTVIGIVAVFALMPIVGYFDAFLQSIGYNIRGQLFATNTVPMLLLGVIVMAFVPAVLEETVFRGIIFQGLKVRGKMFAICATTALFVLTHGSLQQIILPLVLSIFLCVIMCKTQNLVLPITTHFFVNATTLFLGFVGFGISVPLWLALIIFAVGVVVMFGLTRLLKPTQEQRSADEVLQIVSAPTPQKLVLPPTFWAGGIIAFVLFVLAVVSGFSAPIA